MRLHLMILLVHKRSLTTHSTSKKQVRVPVQDPFVHRSARVQQPSVLHVV